MRRNRTVLGMFASLIGGAACLAGCAAAPSARAETPSPSKTVTAAAPDETPSSAEAADAHGEGKCDLVCGAATVVDHTSPEESADGSHRTRARESDTTRVVETANVTLNAMHDDLLACYAARVKTQPKAHAFLTIDIVVGPDGHTQKVEVKGGALLGDGARACIVNRVESGTFGAPPGGGTMRLEVPLTLRRVAPDESI